MELGVVIFSSIVLFCAYFVRGVAGFGSALISVPLLALQFPLTLVVPLIVALDYIGSAGQGFKNRVHIQWPELLVLIPSTVLGIGTALFALSMLDTALLSKMLGGFVILYAIYQLLPLPALRGSRIASTPYGFLGGLVGTAFGTGGPFYVIYLNMRGLGKEAFRASFAAYFVVDGTMRLFGYALSGFFTGTALLYLLGALPAVGLGLYLGGHIHTSLPRETFVRIISVLLMCSGTALLWKG